MQITNISESHILVNVGVTPPNQRCYLVSSISRREVNIIKEYDERGYSRLSTMSGYTPSLIQSMNVGETYHLDGRDFIVTRLA